MSHLSKEPQSVCCRRRPVLTVVPVDRPELDGHDERPGAAAAARRLHTRDVLDQSDADYALAHACVEDKLGRIGKPRGRIERSERQVSESRLWRSLSDRRVHPITAVPTPSPRRPHADEPS